MAAKLKPRLFGSWSTRFVNVLISYSAVEHMFYNYIVVLFFSASPYLDIPHGLGVYPDFVTVQLTLSTGYMSEAQGEY